MDKPLNPMDKQLIAARFAKARNTYTREARVQQQVAEKMMQLIKEPYTRFRRVVEFGCGTGSYSRILLHTLQPEAERLVPGNGGVRQGTLRRHYRAIRPR